MNKITLSIIGTPNVGKSVFFNQLTGGSQHVGNWPGKTVEKAEGMLRFLGKEIKVIDLPGISSLSSLSIEEKIARDFIINSKSDVVLNIADSSSLEGSLYLTLQLLEMNANVVLVLNMSDIANKRGIDIDEKKLSSLLNIPAVPAIAPHSKGIQKTMISVVNKSKYRSDVALRYSKKLEASLSKISSKIKSSKYSKRWLALMLLDNDEEIIEKFKSDKKLLSFVNKERSRLEKSYGQDISTILSSERYNKINEILSECQSISDKGVSNTEKLDNFLMHNFFGYISLALILGLFFFFIFSIGDFLSGVFESFLLDLTYLFIVDDPVLSFLWESISEGIIAGLIIAIPYLLPFYILLAVLEDSGYLPRIAFLMDGLMHRIGLHGKAFIPIVLGYGCSAPACIGCRIMESEKQQFVTAFLVTLIPCAARSVIIFGVVAAFLGVEWAMLLYVFNLLIVFLLGLFASKFVKGKSPALIMNMPTYKVPEFRSIWSRAWFRIKSFVWRAFPIIIIATIVIRSLDFFGGLELINSFLSPVTQDWLGLPMIVGATLITGILRKELVVILLATLVGTANFGEIFTPIQLIVFTVVSIFYIPCAATIATLNKEFGLKKALSITVFDIIFAIVLGGLINIALANLSLF